MRLLVYGDYAYHVEDGRLSAEVSFALFAAKLRDEFERLVLIGRQSPSAELTPYPCGDGIEFVALPYYESLANPLSVARAAGRSLTRFWRTLADVDVVWLLGPHPLAVAFALLAAARGKRVVLGVRQDLPAYVRNRRPGRRMMIAAASLLEASFRLLARRFGVVVVGPELARRYRGARALLQITVSLVEGDDIVSPEAATARSYEGELRLISVGRLDAEKNPLLIADVFRRLVDDGRPWRLTVCGDGALRGELAGRLSELGVAERAELPGYVPYGPRLVELYRRSHALLHTSWTEGMPQVLVEAFAAGVPVVATDVGGIRDAVGEAARLVPPGDAPAAAAELEAIAADAGLRKRLVEAGHDYVVPRTASAEVSRVAEFLRGPPGSG
ncbi:MAG: glycosyltransferase [Solirubrobacterales bacterium]